MKFIVESIFRYMKFFGKLVYKQPIKSSMMYRMTNNILEHLTMMDMY